ncbi:MAG: AbrB/MazE/SpoVT family DNA-binding domain-containing protein [Hyphomonadaceae bacterium]|nr:AbrB/MazE/SpoVT family DNA-binding domain-containing protein [Hyphomonadaceae bacterium]
MQSTLTSKSQATIPKEVREHLGIAPGDTVKYFNLPDGRTYILPVRPAASVRGVLKGKSKRKTPVSTEEMSSAIKKSAVKRYLRSNK